MEEKIKVEFLGGESRVGKEAVNYMLATTIDTEGEEIELYAEVKASDYEAEIEGDFDDFSYSLLKADIIKQAEEKGIDTGKLEFYWD